MEISKRYSSYSYERIFPKLHHNVPYDGQILACAFFAESSNFKFLPNFLIICLGHSHAKSMGVFFRFFSYSYYWISTQLDTTHLYQGPILGCAYFRGSAILTHFAGL